MIKTLHIQLHNERGETLGPSLNVPLSTTESQLQIICNTLLKNEENVFYQFYIDQKSLIIGTIEGSLNSEDTGLENIVNIYIYPKSSFNIHPVTRCTSSLSGHDGAILTVQFSPNGKKLASGSGDMTVRLWDLSTNTPMFTSSVHKNWVLCVSWSSDCKKLVSADKDGVMCFWDADKCSIIGTPVNAHKQWINAIAWEPLHNNSTCSKLATCSKDCTIKIWNTITRLCITSLSGHTASVTCIKWGGHNLLYSASQDKTIKVWRADNGVLCRTLKSHAHWVNGIALNSDYVLRTACFSPEDSMKSHASGTEINQAEDMSELALQRYNKMLKGVCINDSTNKEPQERLVSASDDFTLYLWTPETSVKPLAHMTGHHQTVNDVRFSPDGKYIVSASFDKSIKVWDGYMGKFITSLYGHVQMVYQLSFSSDSRLLVSSSADSTVKIWNLNKLNKATPTSSNKLLCVDLPGHADEVYAVDWSPDGSCVVSGGKDKILKIFNHNFAESMIKRGRVITT